MRACATLEFSCAAAITARQSRDAWVQPPFLPPTAAPALLLLAGDEPPTRNLPIRSSSCIADCVLMMRLPFLSTFGEPPGDSATNWSPSRPLVMILAKE